MKNFKLSGFLFLIIAFSCRSNKTNNIEKESQLASKEDVVLNDNAYELLMNEGSKLVEAEKIGEIKRGVNLNKIVELFGVPEEISEPTFSDVDGETYQTYKYKSKGIIIAFQVKSDSSREVSVFEIAAPCTLQTSKGIGIGSEYDEVQKAYKNLINPQESDTETIIVGSVYGGIVFNLKNNKVKRVYIGESAD